MAHRRMGSHWARKRPIGGRILCVEGTEDWQDLAEEVESEFSLEDLGGLLLQTHLSQMGIKIIIIKMLAAIYQDAKDLSVG